MKAESINDGTFCFHTVKAGTYVVTATKTGFLDSGYGAQSYLQTGTIVAVGGTPVRGISMTLQPMSGIDGQIVDDHGETVANANVVAVRQLWYQGRQVFMPVQGSQSNERGEYRIGKLTPGTYFVYARPVPFGQRPTSVAHVNGQMVRTYHPSALSLTNATAVSVPSGEDVHGIDIRAIKTNTYHVRGRIDGSKGQWVGGSVELLPAEEEQMIIVFGAGNLSPEGEFDFPDITPGSYRLIFQSAAGASKMQVEVKDSDKVVNVPAIENGTIRGKVAVDASTGTESIPIPKITLIPADAIIGLTYQIDVDSNGGIRADGIRPGKYLLKIAMPSGEFVKSITAGTSELNSRELDLTAGGNVELTIVVSDRSAALGGTVTKAAQSSGVRPADVVLIASPARIDGSGLYLGTTDSNGQFLIKNLPPGKYKVCALPSIDVRLFQNPGLFKRMADMGTEVELQEKGNTFLELPPIYSGMLDQLLGSASVLQ
ncbi:MAG: hypothetical protein M3Y24_01710 [Acidobacteriota bacterium]|nr:hypothetical protein [Acidobacteriota bacterium]